MADLVTLITPDDMVIGQMDKIEAHRGDGVLHRAISVFLFHTNGEVLIQQRSEKKIVGALQWANTCCGNVWPDETYEHCAQRRLQAELGITGVALQPVHKFEYHVRCNEAFSEWELDTVFVGTYDGTVVPNPDEVATTAWIPWETFLAEVQEQRRDYAPWVNIMVTQESITTYIQGGTYASY